MHIESVAQVKTQKHEKHKMTPLYRLLATALVIFFGGMMIKKIPLSLLSRDYFSLTNVARAKQGENCFITRLDTGSTTYDKDDISTRELVNHYVRGCQPGMNRLKLDF